METKESKLLTAYLLWFFLAAHYAYVGQWGKQILLWLLLPTGIGAIWWCIDAFRMSSIVEEVNEKRMLKSIHKNIQNTNQTQSVVVNINKEDLQ
jgi:TM2 domain-containing membrane protein YozV